MAEESADFLKIDVKTAQKRVGENVTVRVTCVQKDEESRALNRDKGKYITVDAEKNVAYPSVKRDVTAAVKDAIRNLSSKAFRERPRVLVAGLGNRYVVDTLATAKPMRVFRSFQLTDAGLEPGSATQAGHDKINFESVGVPVIAIGVPTCVYARQIVLDTLEKSGGLSLAKKYEITHEILKENVSALYCPKDSEAAATIAAEIIKDAINGTFQGKTH